MSQQWGATASPADNKVQALEEELSRLRMEHQLLQLEKSAKEAELEKFRYRVDPEIEFRVPSDAGYESFMTRATMPSVGTSPETVREGRKKVALKESIPFRTPTQDTSEEMKTPLAKKASMADEDSLSHLFAGAVESPTNPFVGRQEVLTPEKLRAELMSFATRIGCSCDRPGKDEVIPSVSPRPLKREPRVVNESEMQERIGRKRHRPNIVPDRYSGKVLWREYHRHFESCKKANSWDDDEATTYLAASLQGNALRVLGEKTEGGKEYSYAEMVQLLKRRFDSGLQAENYLVELRHRRQGPKESLQELGQAVRELTVKAYPELQEDARDRLAKNHFHDAVMSQTVREGIHRARPKNLDEAIRAALETENYEKVERQRVLDGKPVKLARALDTTVNDRVDKLEVAMTEQGQKLDAILSKLADPSQKGSASEKVQHKDPKPRGEKKEVWKCFNCGGKGHFARNCKKPPKESDQGNGGQPNEGPAGRLETPQGPQK